MLRGSSTLTLALVLASASALSRADEATCAQDQDDADSALLQARAWRSNSSVSADPFGKTCYCAATSGNKESCCADKNGAGSGTGTFCGSFFTTNHCSGDTPVCCASDGASQCCKQGSTCSSGCNGGGQGGIGFGGCGCVDPPPTTPACPNPVSLSAGTACRCTGDSCGVIPEPDIAKIQKGEAMIVTSQGVPGKIQYMAAEYVQVTKEKKDNPQMDMTLDPPTTYQTILNFGGAFTDATAYNYQKLNPAARKKWADGHFGKNGIGYTGGRVNMNGCDCSRMNYAYSNVSGDWELNNFCLRDDSAQEVPCGTDYKTDVIIAAQQAMDEAGAGKLALYASPWSAPTWLKDQKYTCELDPKAFYPPGVCSPGASKEAITCSNTVDWTQDGATDSSWVSRSLIHSNADTCAENTQDNCFLSGFLTDNVKVKTSWALYFSKFINAYKEKGIDMWGITVQNEPLATTCLWPSMMYTPDLQADFVANYLGPLMRKNHPGVKIMIHDDDATSLADFAVKILSDDKASQYIDGVGYHWYGTMAGVFENGPSKPMLELLLGGAGKVLGPTMGSIPSAGGGTNIYTVYQHLQFQNEDKFIIGTEATNGAFLGQKGFFGPSPGNWGYGYSYSHDIMWSIINGAAGWTDWNLMLDPQGGPNGWGNFLHASTFYETENSFFQEPQFFHLAHFAKYVKPGSKRIELEMKCGVNGDHCQAVAFWTPDDVAVVVITNDEVTGSVLAAQAQMFLPELAKGHGSEMSWTITCKDQEVSGVIPWKGIQTIIMPCEGA